MKDLNIRHWVFDGDALVDELGMYYWKDSDGFDRKTTKEVYYKLNTRKCQKSL